MCVYMLFTVIIAILRVFQNQLNAETEIGNKFTYEQHKNILFNTKLKQYYRIIIEYRHSLTNNLGLTHKP